MSPLAFDKQGKPFSFLRRTKKLLVRLFRNPSARGTCCQVLGPDGQALYVDPETDCLDFRRAVGHVPGLYRLDQCDEDGNELDDAPPAYLSIDTPRNSQVGESAITGDVNPLVIIQQMAAVQADVMKTMAAQQGAVLTAAAEILRAPYRPVPSAPPVTEIRNADGIADDDDDDQLDEQSEDDTPEHPATTFLRMMQPYFPDIGAKLWERCAPLFSGKNNPPPAATPPVAPPRAKKTKQPVDDVELPDARRPDDDCEAAASEAAVEEVSPPSPGPMPMPTPEQLFHLHAVRQRLTPDERKLAETVVGRMKPELLTEWLGKLSAMSVDDATALVRELAADARTSPH